MENITLSAEVNTTTFEEITRNGQDDILLTNIKFQIICCIVFKDALLKSVLLVGKVKGHVEVNLTRAVSNFQPSQALSRVYPIFPDFIFFKLFPPFCRCSSLLETDACSKFKEFLAHGTNIFVQKRTLTYLAFNASQRKVYFYSYGE